jgi:aspartokinase
VDETLFNTIGSHADVMISSQSSTHSFICVVIPTSAGPDAIHTAQNTLEEQLHGQPETQSWQVHPVSIITAIGAKLDMFPALIGEIFQTLHDVRVLAIAQGPSRCSLSLVVEPQDADSALLQIHQMILNNA